jgi:RNA polymerase sigma factor (TIGR02999 family)
VIALPFSQVQAEADGKSIHGCDIFFEPEGGLTIDAPSEEITTLLRAWSSGDEAALGRLAEHVYPELRLMARRYMMNERQGNSLQTTALVHEVYLRLVEVTRVDWHQRAQFFAMAAQIMRRIPWGRSARAWSTEAGRRRSQSKPR